MRIAFEVLAILLLLVANGVFAMSEIAVVTSRRARLERRAAEGDHRAAAAAELKAEPTDFLSAVQIGITLVGILAGAFGGARLSGHLAGPLARIGWLAPWADTVAFVLVVGIITYCSLVIGELVPKRIALSNPEGIAARIARPMQRLARVARPLVALLSASTSGLARLLGVRRDDEPDVTEEDIRSLIAHGARAGVVQATEEDILERVFFLGDRQVRAVMTPRPDVVWIESTMSAARIRESLERSHHSRFLVCEGSIDEVRGVVRATDVLSQCLAGGPLDLSALLRQPHFVPATMPVLQLLERFRGSDVHLAVAIDQYGSVQGVVTLNDILADLVADIPGTVSRRESDVVRRDDGSWLIDGTVPLEDVEEALGGQVLPAGRSRDGWTLGGLVFDGLGRVPRIGDVVELGGFRFEVVDMDGRRVDRVLVRPAGAAREDQRSPTPSR
ncbi:MAG TPA: hemolysin family protein [Gemmatimonadaceae bacterium]